MCYPPPLNPPPVRGTYLLQISQSMLPIPQTQIGAIGVIGWGKTDNPYYPYYPHNPYKKVESFQLSAFNSQLSTFNSSLTPLCATRCTTPSPTRAVVLVRSRSSRAQRHIRCSTRPEYRGMSANTPPLAPPLAPFGSEGDLLHVPSTKPSRDPQSRAATS